MGTDFLSENLETSGITSLGVVIFTSWRLHPVDEITSL